MNLKNSTDKKEERQRVRQSQISANVSKLHGLRIILLSVLTSKRKDIYYLIKKAQITIKSEARFFLTLLSTLN